MPEPHVHGDPEPPIRPHQQHEGEAIHRSALLTEEYPHQALHRGRKGLRKYGIVEDEIIMWPDEQRAKGRFQECLPRPLRLRSLVKRSWETVPSASAKAAQLPDVR